MEQYEKAMSFKMKPSPKINYNLFIQICLKVAQVLNFFFTVKFLN